MQITFREYQREDSKPLEAIIRKTWKYDEFSSPEIASRLAGVFLSSCLTNYTFSRVAVAGGKPAGIILGKNKALHKCPLRNRLRQIQAVLSLYMSKEGRTVSKIFGNVSGIDKELLKEAGRSYPAELALFVVDSSCRGTGTGKKLFQSFLEYMKEQNLEEFYLFTDTSCNYGFYEHQGMTCRCRKEATFHVKGQAVKMNFFIYDFRRQ